MAAVALPPTKHGLTPEGEADAEGEIDDQFEFHGQDGISPPHRSEVDISQEIEAGKAGLMGAGGAGRNTGHEYDSRPVEEMLNGQLEGAADEEVEANDGLVSEGSVAEDGSAIAADEEAASVEEAELEHAARNNCMYASTMHRVKWLNAD